MSFNSFPSPYFKQRLIVSLCPQNSFCHLLLLFSTLAIPMVYFSSTTLQIFTFFQDSAHISPPLRCLCTYTSWKSSLLFTLPLDNVSIFLIAPYQHPCCIMSIYSVSYMTLRNNSVDHKPCFVIFDLSAVLFTVLYK